MSKTEEQRAIYIEALKAEVEMRASRGLDTADAESELARVTGETKRTGTKATRLKGEGRSA